MQKMKAAIFVEKGRIVLDEKPIPDVGPLNALVRITTTTICGTDVHILKGEYLVERGLTIGHEPVGVIEKFGSAVVGFREGQRVIAGAITPSGYSNACQCGRCSQDGPGTRHGWKPMGGWKFGNTIDGCQAEYVLVPDAMGNLAPVPDSLTDEQVLMCPDIMSTGFSGADLPGLEHGNLEPGLAQRRRHAAFIPARCLQTDPSDLLLRQPVRQGLVARRRVVHPHRQARGVAGNIERLLADVDPGYDHAIMHHLRQSFLVREPMALATIRIR